MEVIHTCILCKRKASTDDGNADQEEKATFPLIEKFRLFFGLLSLLCAPAFWGHAAQYSLITEFRSVGDMLVGGLLTVTATLLVLICQYRHISRAGRHGSNSKVNIVIIFFWILYFLCCAYSMQSTARKFVSSRFSAQPLPVFGVIAAATECFFTFCCGVTQLACTCKKSGNSDNAGLQVPLLDPAAVEDDTEDDDTKTFSESPQVVDPFLKLFPLRTSSAMSFAPLNNTSRLPVCQ